MNRTAHDACEYATAVTLRHRVELALDTVDHRPGNAATERYTVAQDLHNRAGRLRAAADRLPARFAHHWREQNEARELADTAEAAAALLTTSAPG